MDEYIKVFTGSAILVQGIARLLEEQRIPFLIKDEKESARLAGFAALEDSVELHVLISDVNKAEKVIEAFTPK